MACVVLASGLSERFGKTDKLCAELGGRPILSHVLDTAAELQFGELFCVSQTQGKEGVTWVTNENPKYGQGHALRLGLKAVQDSGWSSCILMLGDMPLVSARHLKKMIEKTEIKQMLVSICGTTRMPPALFKRPAIDMVLEESSAIGGQILFERLNPETVQLNPEDALDVDTPEDLVEVARILMSRKM